VLLALNYKISL